MSIISQKSDENFQAIGLLIENNLKAPVIHCAYYSCLQKVIHYTYEYSNITEEQIEKGANGQGSHNFYLNTFVKEIRKLDSRNAAQFHKFFSNFKRKRTEADYHKIEILEDDLIHAKENAEKIRKFLKLIDNEGKCENVYYL